MEKRSGIDAVHNFWEQVWQSPQNYDAIDDLVVEDFVIISGGRRIEGREAFKKWAEDFGAAIADWEFELVESFENRDGSRVASTFRNCGPGGPRLLGTIRPSEQGCRGPRRRQCFGNWSPVQPVRRAMRPGSSPGCGRRACWCGCGSATLIRARSPATPSRSQHTRGVSRSPRAR